MCISYAQIMKWCAANSSLADTLFHYLARLQAKRYSDVHGTSLSVSIKNKRRGFGTVKKREYHFEDIEIPERIAEEFGLPADQVPLKAFPVKVYGKGNYLFGQAGLLIFFKTYICFKANVSIGRKYYKKKWNKIPSEPAMRDTKIYLDRWFTIVVEKDLSADLLETVRILWHKAHEVRAEESAAHAADMKEAEYKFTEKEWKDLQSGFDTTVIKKGQAVLTIGDTSRRMVEITNGSCIIMDSQKRKICELNTGDVFNMLGILDPKVKNIFEIVATDDSQIKWIESYYLHIYFQYKQGSGGKFYRKIAAVLIKDLMKLGYF